MRITHVFMTAVAALTALAGCTVKDVDQPALAGPSSFAHSIVMVADRNTLTQNGVDFTDIRITALGPDGQSENLSLRAQIAIDGVAQDFGTLSTKTPTTPTTIRYTAPAASALAAVQVPTTVTIVVTPQTSGDFRNEFSRQVDIHLLPQGVFLPSNPNLVAAFTFSPAAPQAFQIVSFDASTSTNGGVACGIQCSYAWDFGDGTTGTGQATTHQFRSVSAFQVRLTVTDPRGAQATSTQTVTTTTPTPPTVVIVATPDAPVVGQDVFFSGSQSTSPTGRAIVSYQWDFGDGSTSAGVTANHRYSAQGAYSVVLKVTDEVGAFGTAVKPLSVAAGGPAVTFTFLPSAPRVNNPVTVNITATPVGATTIASYSINWGDGSPIETSTSPTQTHVYGGTGSVVITATATDSLGHSRSATQAVTITP